ncbi:MAG: BlaI/MecI/CopY family transcriptional regulator [Planctomycetota bacterium]
MARAKPIRLTSGEVDLMDLLWRHKRLSLAQAHEAYGVDRIGYTTIQTRLNRLVEKGLAVKSVDRPATYSPRVKRETVQAGHLDDVMKRLADGSVVPLVAHLVKDGKIDREELAELKRLVKQAEQNLNSQHPNQEKQS